MTLEPGTINYGERVTVTGQMLIGGINTDAEHAK